MRLCEANDDFIARMIRDGPTEEPSNGSIQAEAKTKFECQDARRAGQVQTGTTIRRGKRTQTDSRTENRGQKCRPEVALRIALGRFNAYRWVTQKRPFLSSESLHPHPLVPIATYLCPGLTKAFWADAGRRTSQISQGRVP